MAARLMEVGWNPDCEDGLGVVIGESIKATDWCFSGKQREDLARELNLTGTFYFAWQIDGGPWHIIRADCDAGLVLAFDKWSGP